MPPLPRRPRTGERFEVHLSTRLPGGFWSAELRRPGPVASLPYRDGRAGMALRLPAGGSATLLAPYPVVSAADDGVASRLWMTVLQLPDPVHVYLGRHGVPIRYSYVAEPWPAAMYQTIFATEPGSAEMPSAGRPFTPDLVTRLVSRGIQIAPLLLHTGVASLEDHEPPYEEFYRVPPATAERVNAVRQSGGRVVAVGTTVVRALETVTDRDRRDPSRRRLDRPRHHARPAAAVGEFDDHRSARTARDAPGDARTGGERRDARSRERGAGECRHLRSLSSGAGLSRGAQRRLSVARVRGLASHTGAAAGLSAAGWGWGLGLGTAGLDVTRR